MKRGKKQAFVGIVKPKIPQKKAAAVSRFLNLPHPLISEILHYSIGSNQDLLALCQTCKMLYNLIFQHKSIWASLFLLKFPNSLSKLININTLSNDLSHGIVDQSKDWKNLYLSQVKKNQEAQIKKLTTQLSKLTLDSTCGTMEKAMKNVKPKFNWRCGKIRIDIEPTNVVYFRSGMTVKLSLEQTCNQLGCLEASISNTRFPIKFYSQNEKMLNSGNVHAKKCGNAVCIMLNENDITFMYFTINYMDIIPQLTKYAVKPRRDDIDSNFGMHSYTLGLEIRTPLTSIETIVFRVVDFVPEGNFAIFYSDELEYKINKNKFVINWKTIAFSGKIQDVCIVDCILRSEFGEPVWWISEADKIEIKERHGYRGDVYSLLLQKDQGEIELFFVDNDAWELKSIQLRLSLSYISSIFVKS
ncbi:unnamed protein product [Blepharisma stoltei]|uniref:F-box domain-containing protein n=1 Tax=Blepharisma stoltei TaxID=1481888 RepID=A0AAU9IA06_9CILI|nr:unnamed protein product [Blepharisma stoltei]